MSLDIGDVIGLAIDVSGRQSISTTLGDANTLYKLYNGIKTGTYTLWSLQKMQKSGELLNDLLAINRMTAILIALEQDKTEAGRVSDLISDVTGADS